MKVTYLKFHNDKPEGYQEDIAEEAAQYLIAVGVAEETKEKREVKPSEKKETTPGKEKKQIDKP